MSSIGFRTRKRGTPGQIGSKFPVFQKKRLPPRISGGKRQLKRVKDTIVIQFEYPDEAEAFRDAYFAVGPVVGFPAPEDEKIVKSTLLLRFDKESVEDMPGFADSALEELRKAHFLSVTPKKAWTA